MFTDDQIELYAEKYFEVPALIRKRYLTFSMFLDLKMYECDICGKSIVEKKYIEIPSYKDAAGFEIYQLQQNGYIRRGWL